MSFKKYIRKIENTKFRDYTKMRFCLMKRDSITGHFTQCGWVVFKNIKVSKKFLLGDIPYFYTEEKQRVYIDDTNWKFMDLDTGNMYFYSEFKKEFL